MRSPKLGTVGGVLLLLGERLLELHQNDENSTTASRFHCQTKRGNPQILEMFRGVQRDRVVCLAVLAVLVLCNTVTTRVTRLVTIPILILAGI